MQLEQSGKATWRKWSRSQQSVDIDGKRKGESISFERNSMKHEVKPAVSRLSSGTSEETFLITTEGLHL